LRSRAFTFALARLSCLLACYWLCRLSFIFNNNINNQKQVSGSARMYSAYPRMNDAVKLDLVLYDCDCLKLTVVIVRSGATARQRHERTVRLRSVVKPGAVVIVGRTETTATFQLYRPHALHLCTRWAKKLQFTQYDRLVASCRLSVCLSVCNAVHCGSQGRCSGLKVVPACS